MCEMLKALFDYALSNVCAIFGKKLYSLEVLKREQTVVEIHPSIDKSTI